MARLEIFDILFSMSVTFVLRATVVTKPVILVILFLISGVLCLNKSSCNSL